MKREAFGQKLTVLRKEKGLTQKEVASCLHVTDKAVSKWERGINFPDITLLQPLADCLGVPIEKLLTENTEQCDQPTKILESCVVVAQEETNRKKWISFFKGILLPLLLIVFNLFTIVSSHQRTIQQQAYQAQTYFEPPEAIIEKLGSGLDLSFSGRTKYISAEGETLEIEFRHKYLCGSGDAETFTLKDGSIRINTVIKSGEGKLIILNSQSELCYFEPLAAGETVILLPDGEYQISVCGYWLLSDIHIDVNERAPDAPV